MAGRLQYRDPGSGHRIVVTTPRTDPELWQRYLDGAIRSYRAFGVESVLDLDRFRDGRATSLLFLALDVRGEVIGGLRSQGPYTDPDEAHAVLEWDADPQGQAAVRAEVAMRIPEGVVESKGGWASDQAEHRSALVECLARGPLHAATILGARYGLGTSAVHTLPMWTGAGAVVVDDIPPVAYPDERYRTRLMWWDRRALPDTVGAATRRAIESETTQLLATAPVSRARTA